MNIGIVGGSIAGCSAAILLRKEGHQVTVFERSTKALVGRGGGIGTTPSLMEQIRKDGLISEDFSYFPIKNMPFVGKTNASEPYGRTAWSMPMHFQVFQWNELWKKLRERVPNEIYMSGIRIIAANMTRKGKVELHSESNQSHTFDLVLFADGYNSLGRSIIFPKKKLEYRGYVLWRGLLPEHKMTQDCPLGDEILRLSYQGKPGHNVVYYIPDSVGFLLKGKRVFNWAAYIAIAEEDLKEVMSDKNGVVRQGTVPPGFLSDRVEKKLKSFLAKNIPQFYGELVQKTKDSYIQVIYTLDLDSYYSGKMALIGDAGMVVQPFTGSGVFKGYHNVKDLITCMKEESTLESALEKWSELQLQTGKRLLALGEQMEKAFIWEPLDFAKVDEETTRSWWKESVTFPDSFNYEKR